jgi:hypothetical protein
VFARHRNARGMDHMSLDGSVLQPAGQPEAVASGLVGNRDPLNQLSRLLGFVCASNATASAVPPDQHQVS